MIQKWSTFYKNVFFFTLVQIIKKFFIIYLTPDIGLNNIAQDHRLQQKVKKK